MNETHHLTHSRDNFSHEVCIKICLCNGNAVLLSILNCHNRVTFNWYLLLVSLKAFAVVWHQTQKLQISWCCKFIRSGNKHEFYQTSTLLQTIAYQEHFCRAVCVISWCWCLWSVWLQLLFWLLSSIHWCLLQFNKSNWRNCESVMMMSSSIEMSSGEGDSLK